VIDGMLDGGVLPAVKHMPGHGRGMVDSHHRLPRVCASRAELRTRDFAPFHALNDCPIGMTAHVVYEALDAEHPATTSASVIRNVIRGEIGFEGLLLTDDISMNALSGGFAERARAALSAGVDIVLHCNGRMDEMQQIASEALPLEGEALARAERALAQRNLPKPFDVAAAEGKLADMLGALA
jgi:beta-N-acetylhexosaminidase